jgi:hypothetical protein
VGSNPSLLTWLFDWGIGLSSFQRWRRWVSYYLMQVSGALLEQKETQYLWILWTCNLCHKITLHYCMTLASVTSRIDEVSEDIMIVCQYPWYTLLLNISKHSYDYHCGSKCSKFVLFSVFVPCDIEELGFLSFLFAAILSDLNVLWSYLLLG